MLRAAHKAMEEVASSILTHGRAQEAEQLCTPVKVIFEEVGFEELKKKEEEFFRQNISVIIPAAGNHRNLGQLCATKPCSLLPLGKKTVIEYQIQELKKMGIRDIIVVRGNHKEKIQLPDIRYYDTETQEKGILATIFAAEGEFTRDLLLVYSDVLFTQELVKKAMARNDEIVIVIDASYRLREGKREGRLDYVMTNSPSDRKLVKKQILVSGIGKEILPAEAHAEFIGITYLSKAGAEYLRKLYHECKQKVPGEFHEAPSFEKASLTDLLLEAIMRGYPVTAIEVHDGWRELQTPEDYQKACLELGGKAYEQIRK